MPRLVHDAMQVDAYTRRIHLTARRFEDQTTCWQNFVNHHVIRNSSNVEATKIIHEQLATWGAAMHGRHVQFESHDHMWQWMLTYA
jgi:hypothetical protein